jgi:hypothetical protein
MASDGRISNIFEINLINKTNKDYQVTLELNEPEGEIETVVRTIKLGKENSIKERFIVEMPLSKIENGKKILHIKVLGNGKLIQTVKTKFIGPFL